MYQPASGTMVYAGFWPRFASLIIDAVLLFVVSFPISLVLADISGMLSIALTFAYDYYCFTQYGYTIGGKVMSLRLVDAQGQKLTPGSAVVRIAMAYVSGIILGIGYLLMIWDPKKQTLHDKVANSYVIKV